MASSPDTVAEVAGPRYAELHCLSSFSFLRGASDPRELVDRASKLGYEALALTDECSIAGTARAHGAARKLGLRLIIGTELRLECGMKLVVLATSRAGYGRLCRLITQGRRAARKGSYLLRRADLQSFMEGRHECLFIWLPGAQPMEEEGQWLAARFAGDCWLGVELLCAGADREQLARLTALGTQLHLPLVACGDVHMHVRERRQLQDVVTAIRLRVPVAEAGWRLHPNGERHLREPARLARLYPSALLRETCVIAARCHFSLGELRYEYPRELVPARFTAQTWLKELVERGAASKWPQGVPADAQALIAKELQLIHELEYEPFFLTVHEIVEFARNRRILYQGRGSAANSVVCFCLGITAIDPVHMKLLFERFLSRERNEPPDIDVDFEHERREEVIQHIYQKYGRHRAALAATVISYRPRSALRDLATALGFDVATALRLSSTMQWWDGDAIDVERIREAGLDPQDPTLVMLLELAKELIGFPRHLSQHVGGFVISEGPLDELVPIENAAMPNRTVIQWDKDDLEELGLIKVDVLALGMLTAIRRCFDLVAGFTREPPLSLAGVPQDDAAVYAMMCRADTVGVFQIESRAQMSMLPRLKPRQYYDLVIEVAIVRPGPIQGDMVHPYLRRRSGEEQITYPSDKVRQVLERTLGVPIFQEQVMQLAIVAAGFTPDEADRLRRAMAGWKRRGGMEGFEQKLIDGMAANDIPESFARQIYQQILGFGEYGFPESHAASFALLVYVSAWLKHHHPAAFTAALLNSLPMGFYAPAQLVGDARAHGVQVRPVDIACSQVDSTLEDAAGPALRLGFDRVKSLPGAAALRIVEARAQAPFRSVQDLGERAALGRRELEALAAAGALRSLGGHRHRAYWNVAGFTASLPTAPGELREVVVPLLTAPTEAQDLVADYRSLRLTLGRHPLALLRSRLAAARIVRAMDLDALEDGDAVRVAGLVLVRQRPGTASGVVFMTLEDESGSVNIVVWRTLGEAQRRELTQSRLLEVRGRLQRESGVTHVIASRLVDHTLLLGTLESHSRDFH